MPKTTRSLRFWLTAGVFSVAVILVPLAFRRVPTSPDRMTIANVRQRCQTLGWDAKVVDDEDGTLVVVDRKAGGVLYVVEFPTADKATERAGHPGIKGRVWGHFCVSGNSRMADALISSP